MPPPTITTDIRRSGSELAHHLDHGFHVLHRRLRQDSVPEVEDVAGARAGALQQIGDVQLELRHRREQDSWIEVALDRRAVADVHPGLVDIDAPIHSENIPTGRMQLDQAWMD